jgi:outer membrane protein
LFICGPTLACVENDTCIQKSSWHIGVALGLGVKTNPLVDGDDIPLVILPDVAWYAEKAYFDNGELGYQWINQTRFAFETFLQVDRERAFFSFLHPANILVPTEGLSPSKPALPDSPVVPEDVTSDEDLKITQSTLSIDDIAKRKWSVNGGIRGHYFLPNGEWQLAIQQDISNVHKGQQLVLEYSHKWLWQKFRFGLRLGTNWKSARLVDYYYGVSERDTNLSQLYFSGKSGWQTYLSANVQKPINENWSWLANIGYRKLPSSLTKSPLVEKNYVGNVFVGIAYRF